MAQGLRRGRKSHASLRTLAGWVRVRLGFARVRVMVRFRVRVRVMG